MKQISAEQTNPLMNARYSSLVIYYFSGTGNSASAARWMTERAKQLGLDASCHDISKTDPNSIAPPPKESLVGLIYPTHGFNAPPIVLDFIRRFPRAEGTDLFLVNCRAGMKLFRWVTPGLSGVAQLLPALMMRLKGYRMVGWRPLDLPSNWLSLHPALRKNAVDFIFTKCKARLLGFTDRVLGGERDHRGLYDLPLDLLTVPIAFLYFFMGRFLLAKTFVAGSRCTDCGLCIKQCPVRAIKKVWGRHYWSFSCESCMKCMNRCPRKAIEVAHTVSFGFWWVASSIISARLMAPLLTEHVYSVIEPSLVVGQLFSIVRVGAILMFIGVSYGLLHLLMKVKWVSKVVVRTSLSHFSFWGRYRAPKGF